MKIKLDNEILDSMAKNPSNWKGIFYVNRKDPRLLVQKQYPPTGWTLNFANPFAYVAIIIFVIIVVLVIMFTN